MATPEYYAFDLRKIRRTGSAQTAEVSGERDIEPLSQRDAAHAAPKLASSPRVDIGHAAHTSAHIGRI